MTKSEEITALKEEIKKAQEKLRELEQERIVFGRAFYEFVNGVPMVRVKPVLGEDRDRNRCTLIAGYHNINLLDAFDQILFDLTELRKIIPDNSAL